MLLEDKKCDAQEKENPRSTSVDVFERKLQLPQNAEVRRLPRLPEGTRTSTNNTRKKTRFNRGK